MQISRLFEIVYILLNRRHVTARELAERFEVSVRTIYRDIDALSQAGVPVYATQGSGGGIFISDAYVLNKSALTDAEQREILVALRSLSATGGLDSARLLSRLGSLFDKDDADWIEVDFSRWGELERDRTALALLKEAILGHHPIAFTYFGGGGVRSQRTVYPLKLIYKSRSWYVQGFCRDRQAFRTFKMVRMANVAMLKEHFDRSALGNPPPLETENNEGPHELLRDPVVVRFQPHIAWRVMDEFDPSLIEHSEDGTLTVTTWFPYEEWTYSYLLSFGEGAEVVSPPYLRDYMREMLQRMITQYEQT